MHNLKGKVALVTGAGSRVGIGRAIALRLARDGGDVAVSDISLRGIHNNEYGSTDDWHGLEDVGNEIRALGRRALVVEADISSNKQVQEMVAKCINFLGKIDILVNCAAVSGPRGIPPFEIHDEEWRRVLDVNIFGTYRCCKTVGNHMIERGAGGKIINIASEGARGRVMPGHGPYIVSKFGIIGLTQVLAVELARYKINVNAVCPGLTATQMVEMPPAESNISADLSLPEAVTKVYADLLPQIPLGRIGQPEDVANVVAFLASSDSDYMTGQSINVTGGHNMS